MKVNRVARIVLVSIICAMANAASAALIGSYGLNETDPLKGKTAVDLSPSVQNGKYTATGTGPVSIASVDPMYGTAVHLDSAVSADYVDLSPFSGLTQNGALTYALWVKPDATQLANPTLIGNLNDNLRGYSFRIVPSGSNWSLKLAASNATFVTTVATIPSGVWSHVAVTKDVNGSGGTNLSNYQFYVNGIPVDSGTIAQTGAPDATTLYIGVGRSGTSYLSGGVDEVQIYNEVLSGSAIAALANVPEPATVMLLGLGGVALVGYRRRGD